MTEISETKIKKMTKEQNYLRGYKDGKSDVLNKIRAEIIEYAIPDFEYHGCGGSQKIVELEDVLQIIDKYKAESEE
jgi:hypothetical protein